MAEAQSGLALSRMRGERVLLRLGEVEIWVTVVEIRRGRVRLHFQAPREVQILREEVIEAWRIIREEDDRERDRGASGS